MSLLATSLNKRMILGRWHTFIQIVILVVLIPLILFLLHLAAPAFVQDLFLNGIEKVPYLSKFLGPISTMVTLDITPQNALLVISDIMNRTGNSAFDVFFVALMIIVFEEIDTLIPLNRGMPILAQAIAIYLGVAVGWFVDYLHITQWQPLIAITMIMLVVSLILIIIRVLVVDVPHGRSAARIWRGVGVRYGTAGVSAIVGGMTVYWACCFMEYLYIGNHSFKYTLLLVLIPTLVELLALAFDILLYLAANGKKVRNISGYKIPTTPRKFKFRPENQPFKGM